MLDFKIVKSLQCILNGRAVVEGLVAKNLVDKKMDLLLNYWQLKATSRRFIIFHFSNNDIGFNALNRSCAKAHSIKEQKYINKKEN